MNRGLGRFKTFWAAEEIPRSIGLLLVVVYVAALGAIGLSAHLQMRAFDRAKVTESRMKAVQLLAAAIDPSHLTTEPQPQTLLKRFAAVHHCLELRVYDDQRRVVASLTADEVGKVLPRGSAGTMTGLDEQPAPGTSATAQVSSVEISGIDLGHVYVRAQVWPVRFGTGAADQTDFFVEGVFDVEAQSALAVPVPLWSWLVALASTIAFLLAYRRLRRHFRSISRIADKLVRSSNEIEQTSFCGSDLRIDGTDDTVAACWNKLVDTTVSLREEVERSRASSELLAALSKTKAGELAEAMTAVPVGIILTTDSGVVMYANAMSCRLVGWPPGGEASPTLAAKDITGDGSKIVEFIRSCLNEHGSYRTLDRQIAGDDGSHYYVQVVPVRTQQQTNRFVVLILDVSQQVRADHAREEFVSQVTHELRTPLTNIRAYAETLSSGMFDDPQVVTECYNVITKETRRLSRLIEDILSISQLEVGTMQLVIDNIDLRPLLTEAVRDVRGIAEGKSIDLQLDLPPKIEPIQADRDKLAVVVNNLLGNSLKYTPSGGSVVLSCRRNGDVVQISVRDTGIGIDPKDHARIFENFERGDDEAVRAEPGTGIGLTTAREITRQHGGDITVVSKKGEGATFTVSIPMRSSAPAAVEASV